MSQQSYRNPRINSRQHGCNLPFERPGTGDGYACSGAVTTYTLSPEEIAKLPAGHGEKVSPLANIANEHFTKVCPKLNQRWREHHIAMVKKLWSQGAGIDKIAAEFSRAEIDVVVLVYHLAEVGQIGPRREGLFGS